MSGETDAAPEEWRRTSPASFLVRAVMGLRNLVFPALALLFGTQGWDGGGVWVVPAILGMVLFSGLFTYIAWRNFRYRLGTSDIRVEHGLLSRTARSVPYERIQDVSLEQSLVPRLFGMVEAKFETGAGGKDELKIGYVSEAEGAALRETVRALRSGAPPAGSEGAPAEEPARILFAMDTRRLLTFGVFEFSLAIFAVLAGAAQQFDFLFPFDIWDFEEWGRLLAGPGHRLAELGAAGQALGAVLALVTLGLIGLGTGIVRTVLRDYGFRLEETPKGLRRRRGLFTRTDVTMPFHRVQALRIASGVVRRRFGWHGLGVISLAQDAKAGNNIVAPFARMEEIAPIVSLTGFALPGEELAWRGTAARYRFDRWLFGSAVFTLATLAIALPLADDPRLLAFVLPGIGALGAHAWLRWRRDRHARDARQLYSRTGWFAPGLAIVSQVKLQSVEIVQGPLARRRGYATLHLGLAGGTFRIDGMAVGEAMEWRRAILASISGTDFSELLLAPDQARSSDHSGFSANFAAT